MKRPQAPKTVAQVIIYLLLLLASLAGWWVIVFVTKLIVVLTINACRILLNQAAQEQPKPKGQGVAIAELVKTDIEARVQLGEQRYGERLRANNGRDALMDMYQESLDLCMYFRQLIEERRSIERPDGTVSRYIWDIRS